jgi:hypothetical protein
MNGLLSFQSVIINKNPSNLLLHRSAPGAPHKKCNIPIKGITRNFSAKWFSLQSHTHTHTHTHTNSACLFAVPWGQEVRKTNESDMNEGLRGSREQEQGQ